MNRFTMSWDLARGRSFCSGAIWKDGKVVRVLSEDEIMTVLEAATIALIAKLDEPPLALTEKHLAELERAIRAEGYSILANPETGSVRLARNSRSAVSPPFTVPEGIIASHAIAWGGRADGEPFACIIGGGGDGGGGTPGASGGSGGPAVVMTSGGISGCGGYPVTDVIYGDGPKPRIGLASLLTQQELDEIARDAESDASAADASPGCNVCGEPLHKGCCNPARRDESVGEQ